MILKQFLHKCPWLPPHYTDRTLQQSILQNLLFDKRVIKTYPAIGQSHKNVSKLLHSELMGSVLFKLIMPLTISTHNALFHRLAGNKSIWKSAYETGAFVDTF